MKTIITILLLTVAASGFGQPTGPAPATVHIATEVEELARGYAAAFPTITRAPIYLTVRKNGTTMTLVSVRSVKAAAGVLIVEIEKGFTYILNPEDVIAITDAPPAKEPQPASTPRP
jgi:hypothetical protein